MAYETVYYRSASGGEPVKEFVDNLNYKIQQKFFAREEVLLQSFGEKLIRPHAKHLEDGMWELKVDLGNLAYRFLYFLHGRTVVYLHAFQKKTEKTPQRELELAFERRRDFYQQLQRGDIEL